MKKDLIRNTAIDLFADKGFNNISTSMIAKRAKISVGTIYNYFNNKDEILDYIFYTEYINRKTFLLSLEDIDISMVKKIQLFIEYYYSMMLEYPNVTKVIIQDSMNPSNLKLKYVRKSLTNLSKIFTNMLKNSINKGEITGIDPNIVGPAIYHTISGVAYNIQTQMQVSDYSKAMDELNNFITLAIQG